MRLSLFALTALAAVAAAADLKCEHRKDKANGAAVRYLGATPDVRTKVREKEREEGSGGESRGRVTEACAGQEVGGDKGRRQCRSGGTADARHHLPPPLPFPPGRVRRAL
jgi:hypothetical protein